MTDIKTTVAGAVAGIAQLAKIFGLDIPAQVLDSITAVGVMIAFYFAKDKGK